jgi:trans-aconitate methyltransferase
MNFEDAREAPARCLTSNVLDLATGQGQDGGCGRGVAGRCAGRKKRAGPQNKMGGEWAWDGMFAGSI